MKRMSIDWMCDECGSDEETKTAIKLPIDIENKAVRLDFCNKKCRTDFAKGHRDEGN